MSSEFLRTRRSQRLVDEVEANSRKRRGTGLFWWILLIILLSIAVVASWFFSIFIFTFPESPRHYKLLAKLDKLPEITTFKRANWPRGRFQSAKQLYSKYHPYVHAEADIVREFNAALKRSYIRNFQNEKNLPYLRGEFVIYRVRALEPGDAFPEGVVVRARSDDFPKIAIEYYYPGDPATITPDLFQVGSTLKTGTTGDSSDFPTPIHVRAEPEDYMCLSVVPIMYQYRLDQNIVLKLSPPRKLTIDGRWEAFPADSVKKEEEASESGSPPTKAIKVDPGKKG
ncbi:MAG: hypothetical protein AAGJ79_09650 [Verrucomicrobiota bacterium]